MNSSSYGFFIAHSDEKNQQISILRRKIGGVLLDIGPGEGTITLSLKNVFDRVEVVEEKGLYCDKLAQHGIICHKTKFEQFETSTRYDVILASHVLTYLDDKESMIAKMYELLKVGGRLFIFNMAYDGLMQVIKEKIHPNLENRTDLIVQEILKKYARFEREVIPINLSSQTPEEMAKLVEFLSEKDKDKFGKEKENIQSLIQANARQGDKFILNYYNVVYTIHKI